MIKLQKKKELNSKLSIKNEGNNHIKTGNGESDYINRILEKEKLTRWTTHEYTRKKKMFDSSIKCYKNVK